MCYELVKRKQDTQKFCSNGCYQKTGGFRVAVMDEFIAGYPSAGLCEPCSRAARRAWSDARLGWTDQVAA